MSRVLSFSILIVVLAVHCLPSSLAQSPSSAESIKLNQEIIEFYRQGKYKEAVPLAKRAVEIEKATGLSQPGVAVALANLGELYLALDKNDQAEEVLQEALTILDQNQMDSALTNSLIERLAQLSFHRRESSQAIALLERSLKSRERLFGRASKEAGETLHELANVYRFTGGQEKAEEFYLRSIRIMETSAGRKDANTISIMKDYACLGFGDARVISAKEETNTEDEQGLSESEKEKRSIRKRARCWLFGFEDDCDNKVYTPKIAETVLNGKAVKLVQPPYPYEARAARASGRIIVAIRINESGKVIDARPVCGGHPTLFRPSLEAARASQFTPTILDGRPATVSGVIIYNFIRN